MNRWRLVDVRCECGGVLMSEDKKGKVWVCDGCGKSVFLQIGGQWAKSGIRQAEKVEDEDRGDS